MANTHVVSSAYSETIMYFNLHFQSTKELDSLSTVKVLADKKQHSTHRVSWRDFNKGIIYRVSGANKGRLNFREQQQQESISTSGAEKKEEGKDVGA